MDSLTPAERSQRMSLVRSKDTKPEIEVRRLVFSMGYRYRLHVGRLPGRPDLVFSSRRKVIFVHGCFWHRHKGCPNCRLPKTRLRFWKPKLEKNRERDVVNRKKLKKMGWGVLVIWECEIKNTRGLAARITQFMEGKP
jgi:DNA mismatch endonuclease, patch repair protein